MLTVKSFMPLAFAVVLVVGGLTVIPGQASAVTLNVFTDPHVAATSAAFGGAGTIGFAYAGDKFVGTVQKDGTNVLYSTNLTGVMSSCSLPPSILSVAHPVSTLSRVR